jgi:hypothetical protein
MFGFIGKIFRTIVFVLKDIHEDSSGQLSWMRVTSTCTLVIVLGMWIGTNLKAPAGVFVDFGPNSVIVILTVLGFKVGQKLVEEASAAKQKELDNSIEI